MAPVLILLTIGTQYVIQVVFAKPSFVVKSLLIVSIAMSPCVSTFADRVKTRSCDEIINHECFEIFLSLKLFRNSTCNLFCAFNSIRFELA